MRCFILITIFLTCISAVNGETPYAVTRNVVQDSVPKSAAIHEADSFTLSVCTNECTFSTNCASALHDEHSNMCYLYTTNYLVTTESVDTGLTYIEKEDCSWTENCCSVGGSMSCMEYGQYKVYQDCQDAFEQGETNSGEVYNLQPDPTWVVIRAVCEFDSASGWTVIQRRLDGSVDFYRNWANYTDGFGDLNGEYWIGLEALYLLTRWNNKLSLNLEDHNGDQRTANYSTFTISAADSNYTSSISGFSGDVTDSLLYHSGWQFSTYDKDNDRVEENCAEVHKGAWWYRGCLRSNLNGKWVAGGVTTEVEGIIWKFWKELYYSLKTVCMKLSR